jgi:hypothetical protein
MIVKILNIQDVARFVKNKKEDSISINNSNLSIIYKNINQFIKFDKLTPLFKSCYEQSRTDAALHLLRMLQKLNKLPNEILNLQDKTGRTPAHFSIASAEFFTPENIKIKNDEGETPVLTYQRNFGIASLLKNLKPGIIGINDIFEQNKKGVHVLTQIIFGGYSLQRTTEVPPHIWIKHFPQEKDLKKMIEWVDQFLITNKTEPNLEQFQKDVKAGLKLKHDLAIQQKNITASLHENLTIS